MSGTQIWLDGTRHQVLARIAELRGLSVEALVAEAVDVWLGQTDTAPADESWRKPLSALLDRRREIADELGLEAAAVEAEVAEAVGDVRRRRSARRS